MKRLFQAVAILAGVIVLILLGLSALVHFYLTPERLKDMIVPLAEKASGRKVELGEIEVGLLKGIRFKGLKIKEDDGKNDFLRIKEFVLSYQIFPLLKHQLIISEVKLLSPEIRIVKRQDGHFNFETLKLLEEEKKEHEAPERESEAPEIPLALVVDRVVVKGAQFFFKDETGELPQAQGEADLNIGLKIGRDLSSLTYQGSYLISSEISYQGFQPLIQIKGRFDQQKVDYQARISLDKEEVFFSGHIQDYLQKRPQIRCDVKSHSLNLDHILSVAALAPQSSKKRSSPVHGEQKTSAANDILAFGQIEIDRVIYQKMTIEDLRTNWQLEGGIFELKDLTARVAQGQIKTRLRLNLATPLLAYEGEVKTSGLDLGGLLFEAAGVTSPPITGVLDSRSIFSGRGTEWSQISKDLFLDGRYSLLQGMLRESPVVSVVADLLGLQELKKMVFERLEGSVKIKEGKAQIKADLKAKDISIQAQGTLGLDGSLNLPLKVYLSGTLAQKVARHLPGGHLLLNQNSKATVDLKLRGTIFSPRVTLNQEAIQKRLKEELPRQIFKKLGIPFGP
ncbi:DUF748 domain-containing protein [Thermosulfuriphilus sp.]